MRKANKILMATVAILLCLVLITTSITSGIFARFVIMNKSESTITLQNFGVNVTMTVDEDGKVRAANENVKIETKKVGDSIHVTVKNLTLYPGDGYGDTELDVALQRLVKFTFGNNPDTPDKAGTDLQIKLRVDVTEFNKDNYKVTAEQFDYIKDRREAGATDDYFVPLGFYLVAPNSSNTLTKFNINSPWRNVLNTNIETTTAKMIGRYTDMLYKNISTDPYVYKDFKAGDNIVFHYDNDSDDYQNDKVNESITYRTFYLGFYIPMIWDLKKAIENKNYDDEQKYYTADEINEITTWLLNQTDRDFAMDVKFILEITQK